MKSETLIISAVILVMLFGVQAPAPHSNGGLGELKITTDKCSYGVGELVRISFSNVGNGTIEWPSMGFPSKVPYQVFDEEGDLVWQIQLEADVIWGLSPGEQYNTTWNQTYNAPGTLTGEQVPKGAYRVYAEGFAGGLGSNVTTSDSVWIWIGLPCGGSGPVADAGLDQTVYEGEIVQFNGSESKGSTITTDGKLPRIANYSCPPRNGLLPAPSEPDEPFENLIKNGNFEYGMDSWPSVGSVSISSDIVYNGSSALLVNTSAESPGYVYQKLKDPGKEYVIFWWIYLVSASDDPFVIKLVRNWDQDTGKGDVAALLEVKEDKIGWTMWNKWLLSTGPVSPNMWHRIVLGVNDSAKFQCLWVDYNKGMAAYQSDVTPFTPEYLVVGDVSNASLAGIAYFDNFILVGARKENLTRVPITSYNWDFNNFLDSDGNGNFTDDVDATGATPTHAYGDNGNFTVTLKVTDELGYWDIDSVNIVVLNVPPEVTTNYTCTGGGLTDILLRIAGEKWHDVSFVVYENGNEVYNETVLRLPGSPNEQIIGLEDFELNASRSYSAVVRYTPEDDDVNGQVLGATPAWMVLRSGSEEVARLHHTFNVKHPETWEWRMDDLSSYLPQRECLFTADISDPGSDDLYITWDWGDGTTTEHVYYNNEMSPDPYPSPEVNPVYVTDTAKHSYGLAGSYLVVVTVEDDDGGQVQHTFVLNV